jgi:hypothetical protein
MATGEDQKEPSPRDPGRSMQPDECLLARVGIPLVHPFPDGDFGLAGSSRRNTHRKAGKFGKIAGWYGHGDMPDPDVHWDPGSP